jgi:hypothetical protein
MSAVLLLIGVEVFGSQSRMPANGAEQDLTFNGGKDGDHRFVTSHRRSLEETMRQQ